MTATEHSVESLDRKLNEAILSGKALEAFDEYYADDVTMQENNGEPFAGKAVNREREVKFFSTVAQLHEIKLLASAVNGNVSFGEWLYDITFKDGNRYSLEQVAVRRWKNGKVAAERFYYKG
jgi:ketosteroid isomerase-like protein